MYDDLAFREYRIPFKHIALYGAACAGAYAAVAAFGVPAACAIGALTLGYVAGRFRK